jgi:hypothetical protein
MAQQAKRMFREVTRQSIRKNGGVNPIVYGASGGGSLALDKVGMLSRIILQFRGTVTLSGAGSGTISDKGPWNILSRVKVNVNGAALTLWDTTGYGAYVQNGLIDICFRPDAAGAGNTTPDALIHAAPTAAGANTWLLTWILPISANQGSQFETGLINLQSPEVTVTVEPTFGALTDPNSLVTAITGNLHTFYEYYEIPDPRLADLPPVLAVRTIEDNQPINGTGDNTYTVPRGGNLMSLAHIITLNAARNHASIDNARIIFNKATTVYNIETQIMRLRNREFSGLDAPTGVLYHDFFHATQDMSAGDNRDFIDTEELSTLESVLAVSSGATLGSNNNSLATVRRILQVFQA